MKTKKKRRRDAEADRKRRSEVEVEEVTGRGGVSRVTTEYSDTYSVH